MQKHANALLASWTTWHLFLLFWGFFLKLTCDQLSNAIATPECPSHDLDMTVEVKLFYACHRRSKTFPLWQAAPVLSVEWEPPLLSVSFSIKGDPLTQALFDHLLFRQEHQAPLPNLAAARLDWVPFEKHHCWSGWEADWTQGAILMGGCIL